MEIEANGITVNYELVGPETAPAVTLIHALRYDLGMWWQQVPVLAPKYRVLSYDIRGHGRSSKPAGPYSLELYAEDLRALLEALGIKRSHLVGLSIGGMIPQALAIAHPEVVSSMVLANTASDFKAPRRAEFEERARTAETRGMAALVEYGMEHSFTPPFREQHPDIVERFRQTALRNDSLAYAAAARAVGALHFVDDLHRVECPTLILAGAADTGTTTEMAEVMQQRIPRCRLQIIPQAAHLSAVEQAEAFNKAMLEFLTEVEAA